MPKKEVKTSLGVLHESDSRRGRRITFQCHHGDNHFVWSCFSVDYVCGRILLTQYVDTCYFGKLRVLPTTATSEGPRGKV